MRMIVPRVCARALVAIAATAPADAAASAQTTVIINDSRPDVVYATLRAGAYADANLPTVLTTRAADTSPNNHRRALLKFDTQNRIPAGSSVTSALLTVTVKSGGTADTTRTIGAYQVTTSWAETETTWNRRRTTTAWLSGGGDLGSLLAKQVVSNVAGTKVTFDITSLVKAAVPGQFGSSRYTRVALVDVDSAATDSTRNFYTPDDANSALRPTLKVSLAIEQRSPYGHVGAERYAPVLLEHERCRSVVEDGQRAPQIRPSLIHPGRWGRLPDRSHRPAGVIDRRVRQHRRAALLEPLFGDADIVVGEGDDRRLSGRDSRIQSKRVTLARLEQVAKRYRVIRLPGRDDRSRRPHERIAERLEQRR